ncbi:MAG: hypothetical protein ACOC1U_04080 [Spirochaetota bacterium]
MTIVRPHGQRATLLGCIRACTLAGVLAWTLASAPLAAAQEPAPETGGQALQRGFSSLELGMNFEQARVALLTDQSFRYRGEPDIQFLPVTRIPIIETAGRAFVDRAVLQFHDDTLYIISLLLDRSRLDYFSVYEALVEQYGEPDRLDPGQSVWENESTRISLERPLTVKYLDRATFTGIVESGRMEAALEEVTRERFLEQL